MTNIENKKQLNEIEVIIPNERTTSKASSSAEVSVFNTVQSSTPKEKTEIPCPLSKIHDQPGESTNKSFFKKLTKNFLNPFGYEITVE